MNRTFRIGELAQEAGVNPQTVRYYERLKLLTPVGRKSSGYRLYDEATLKRLLFIRHAKELGFTLQEISELLALRVDTVADCEKAQKSAKAKLINVEQKLKSLETVKKVLMDLLTACEKRKPTDKCPILQTIEKGR
jgi:MerR family copper efflux transcriptional regulator